MCIGQELYGCRLHHSNGQKKEPLIERWNGVAWSIVRSVARVGVPSAFLSAVSCRSSFDCTAVGAARRNETANQPLIEHWNGTVWS